MGLRRDLGDRDRGWITNIGHRRITQNIINFGPQIKRKTKLINIRH